MTQKNKMAVKSTFRSSNACESFQSMTFQFSLEKVCLALPKAPTVDRRVGGIGFLTFTKSRNEEQFEKLINGFGFQLKELKNNFPLTIIQNSSISVVLVTICLNGNLVMTNIFLLGASMFPLTDCLHKFIHVKANR